MRKNEYSKILIHTSTNTSFQIWPFIMWTEFFYIRREFGAANVPGDLVLRNIYFTFNVFHDD